VLHLFAVVIASVILLWALSFVLVKLKFAFILLLFFFHFFETLVWESGMVQGTASEVSESLCGDTLFRGPPAD